jgi:hypothetical protein
MSLPWNVEFPYATRIYPYIQEKGKYSVEIRRNVGEELNSSEQRDYCASLRLYVDLLQISYEYRNNEVLYERLHSQTVCGWNCVQLCRMAGFSIYGK